VLGADGVTVEQQGVKMLKAGNYPITIVEFESYARDAEKLLGVDGNESLKGFLSINPEYGEVVPETNGIRHFMWPGGCVGGGEPQLVYFFRDLNMPVYLIAIFPNGDAVNFDDEFRQQLAALVESLIQEHMAKTARVIQLPKSSA
jgi:hypothetical protein